MNSDYMKGFMLTAGGVIVLSFDALLIRLIEADSFDLLFWRGLLLSLVVALWCRFSSPGQALICFDGAFLRSALLFVISTIAFVCAVNLTSVANVLVIISAQPLFAAVMARIFVGEKSPPITSPPLRVPTARHAARPTPFCTAAIRRRYCAPKKKPAQPDWYARPCSS